MTRHPFNDGELGRDDANLSALAEELERLSVGDPQPSPGFHDRVLTAIEAEPAHRRSWLAGLLAGDGGRVLQFVALVVIMASLWMMGR